MLKKVRQIYFIDKLRKLIPEKLVNLFYHLPKAILAVLYYGYPAGKLFVIGVTGTKGKTTTCTLIYEILKKAGFKTALISSLSAKIGKLDFSTGLHVTSPGPWQLQKILRLIADKNFKYVVLESTSHGLEQYRLWGCNFKIGVITNIAHEHLDYHKNLYHYLRAKAKLFNHTDFSILNKEDESFKFLKAKAKGKIITYGIKEGDWTPQKFPFKTKLLGDFNLLNSLAAISVAKVLNIKDGIIRQALKNFKGICGRMEEIDTRMGFRVFIDFAHTPDSLEQALITLKGLKPRKLIAVFGAAGLRDHLKRPKMGRIACELADKVILTAEDPRIEDVDKIIEQIASGCITKGKFIKMPDRQKAIDLAIKMAKADDLIGIFGKGHEQSMCFGTKEYPWSDHLAVKKALKRRFSA